MRANPAPDPETEMGKVIAFPNACAPSATDQALLSTDDRALLEAARWWLTRSRLTARAIIDEACFLLANGIPCEASAYGTAFFRLLDLHAKRELRFFAMGVEAVTGDERWFLQLLNAAIDGDDDGVGSLISWRLDTVARRRAVFLINQLAQHLHKKGLESREDMTI